MVSFDSNSVLKSSVSNVCQINKIARISPKSPIRLTTKAFFAAAAALEDEQCQQQQQLTLEDGTVIAVEFRATHGVQVQVQTPHTARGRGRGQGGRPNRRAVAHRRSQQPSVLLPVPPPLPPSLVDVKDMWPSCKHSLHFTAALASRILV